MHEKKIKKTKISLFRIYLVKLIIFLGQKTIIGRGTKKKPRKDRVTVSSSDESSEEAEEADWSAAGPRSRSNSEALSGDEIEIPLVGGYKKRRKTRKRRKKRKKRRKTKKRKRCTKKRLRKKMICVKGPKKKLKKLRAYTKKIKLNLTRCSKKRMKKWTLKKR